MTSILSELKGSRSDTIAILSRIFEKGSNQIVGSNLQNEIITTVEQLITSLNTKCNGRNTTCHVLSIILKSLHKLPELEGRFYTVVDRLPTILESVALSLEETDGFELLLNSILNSTDEMITRMNKILPKIVSISCRLCEKENTLLFGLSVLISFAMSKSRMLLYPSASAVRRCCYQAIDHTIYYTHATHLLALQNSTETPENWMNNWSVLTVECVRIIQLLGIKINVDKSVTEKCVPLLQSNTRVLRLHGCRKALAVERALRGFCASLDKVHIPCFLFDRIDVSFLSVFFFNFSCVVEV